MQLKVVYKPFCLLSASNSTLSMQDRDTTSLNNLTQFKRERKKKRRKTGFTKTFKSSNSVVPQRQL